MVNRGILRLYQFQLLPRQTDVHEFARQLQTGYRKERGFLRYWFSVYRFSHCEFRKFIMYMPRHYSRVAPDTLPSGLPKSHLPEDTNTAYYFAPRPAEDDPPVIKEEFQHIFNYRCREVGGLPSSNELRFPLPPDIVPRIPQRYPKFPDWHRQRMELWGLHAVEEKSLFRVVIYVLLASAPTVAFIFVYIFVLRHLGIDMQNPTVPLVVLLGILALLGGWLYKI